MVDEREPVVRRALLNPLELCLGAIKVLLRQPLERFGQVMFDRGVRYERERLRVLASSLPPPPENPAVTEERELDLDKTPTRAMRPLELDALRRLDERALEGGREPAHEAVVSPRAPDPRSK